MIFIFLTLIFLTLSFYQRSSQIALRAALIHALVVMGGLLALLTEILNMFQQLSDHALLWGWGMIALGAGYFLYKSRFVFPLNVSVKPPLDILEKIMGGWVVLTVFLVGVTAALAPPNTWDSLVYHMSRVMHWQQNHSLAHYPTSIKTQLYFPPFAEWVILHFQILSGSDRYANFVQWFAMGGSIVLGSLIVQMLGGARRAQCLAAFLIATIPMGILQGSSTQNDYVLSFWLMAFVYYGLLWLRQGQLRWIFLGSLALALAILTKGTAIIWVSGFGVWMLWTGFLKFKHRVWRALVVTVFMVVLLNVGHWSRNVQLTGRIFGEAWVTRMTTMEKYSVSAFASNLTRNIGLHAATSAKSLNQSIKEMIVKGHEIFHVDIADPKTTFLGYSFDISVSTFEDNAGMFCQGILIFLTGIGLLLIRREPYWGGYALASLWAMILFTLFIKWQPSGSRLHLPFFIFMMPLAAVVLTRIQKYQTIFWTGLILVFITTSVPYLFRNSSRKLFSSKKTVFTLPRQEQIFIGQKEFYKPYQNAIAEIKKLKCQQIGLRIGDNGWEYPFWVMLHEGMDQKFRFEHVAVDGLTPREYPLGSFHPCAIIETSCTSPENGVVNWQGQDYQLNWSEHPVKIYIPQSHE